MKFLFLLAVLTMYANQSSAHESYYIYQSSSKDDVVNQILVNYDFSKIVFRGIQEDFDNSICDQLSIDATCRSHGDIALVSPDVKIGHDNVLQIADVVITRRAFITRDREIYFMSAKIGKSETVSIYEKDKGLISIEIHYGDKVSVFHCISKCIPR